MLHIESELIFLDCKDHKVSECVCVIKCKWKILYVQLETCIFYLNGFDAVYKR